MTSKASLLDIAYGAGGNQRHAAKKKACKYLVSNNVATLAHSPSIAPVSALSKTSHQYEERNAVEHKAKTRKRHTVQRNATVLRAYEEAIRRRDLQSVLWMITNGDVEADHETVNGETAMLAAVASKQTEVIVLLIKNGVSVDSANEKGYTPLMKAIATASPFVEISALLVSTPKLRKQSPQEQTIGNNHENANVPDFHASQFDNEIVKVILAFNPDLMKRDALGKTAFDWARCTGNVYALALLESHLQASSLHHAASSTREQRIAACRALLQRHEEYVASTEAFLTKHSFGENEFVQFLNASRSQMPREELSVCVDDLKMAHAQPASEDPVFFVDHETRQGWTPLTKCASNGYVEAVQVLLEMGATLHHETRLRHTAMTWACYCGHEAVVLYLLRIGVNVDQKTREGKTALIHAVSNAQAKIVHHLLLALRERSLPAKAKGAFDSQLTLLNRRKSMKSAWKRMTAEDAPMENKLEWHETFCNLIHWRDQTGKSALDYATHMGHVAAGSCGSSNATVVLDCLQSALRDAQNHLEYVEANEARTLTIPCSSPECRYIGPRDTMTIHEKYQCVKRTIHCDYCSEPIVFETQQEHEKNDCVQRKVPCVNLQFGCHDRVLFSDLSNHASHHCRKRLMECRLLCGRVLLFEELFTHETTQCSLRTIECAWGCPSTFMAKESGNHQRKQCPKRLVPCVGDRCSTTRASQRQSGSSTALTSGCGMQVVAEEMQFHLTHLCENRKVACKWAIHGCEEAIGGSAESRRHHEERACPFRLVPCRNECELSGELLACFLPEHYEWQCLLENKPCPNKCPAPVIVEDGSNMNSDVLHLPAHLLDVHVLEDAGDCPKRLARCPLDLCGKHVNLFDMWCNRDEIENGTRSSLRAMRQRVRRSQHFLDRLCAVICDTTATDYDTTSVNDQADEILEICTRSSTMKQLLVGWLTDVHRKLTCELDALESETKARSLKLRVLTYAEDKHLLEFPDGHSEWIPLQSREYDVVLQSQQQISKYEPTAMNANLRATAFQCPLIEADNLKVHMETKCHLRLLPCPLACGQRLPVHGIATHIAKRCNVRNAKCRLGCGAVLPFTSLMEHEEQTCELRVVFCEHCHESIPWRSMAQHLEKTCTKLPRRCRLGCGLEVSWSESATHEESECPKRLVLCTQCEKSIWFGERDFHEQHECPLRIYGLCEANCGETLRHNEVGHHLLFNCSQRVVTCAQCDQRTVFAKLQEHKALQCPQRVLFCHRGCGHTMKEIDAEAHEEGECVKRLVYCSNRCGLEVPYCALNNHLEVECNMRVIECPRGCQERLLAYQIETHWRRCRQRVVPCGTGAKLCARPIRLWVSVRKLVRCATHNDNALLWALKCQDDDLVTYLLQQVTPITAALQDEFSNGFSPLTMAVNVGNVEIVKLLLRFGADVNLETSRGRTPLAEACLAQNPELVELLLEHRANVSHTNRHGQNLMKMVRALAATVAPDDALAQEKWKTIITLLEERETMERDQRELFLTIATSNYDYVASFLKYSATSSNEPTLRFNQLESLQAALHEHEKQVAQAKIELAEAIRVLNESVADAEAKTVNVAHLSEQLDDCASQIQRVDCHHDASEANSNALEAEMLKLIREITAQNIAQLLNVHVPSDKYLVVMKAICMISGVLPRGRRSAAEYTDMEWWKAAQALLMDRTLLQRLRGYRKQLVTPDVMAKVRRECMRTPAFAAASAFSSGGDSEDAMKVPTEERKSSALPTMDELRGDIVSLLAAWVKGVEMEYKTRSERQTLGERKRRLAISLHAAQGTLQQARFDMQVATRSLPARQEEVEIARSKTERHEKEHFAAQQRLKTYKILNFAALNGHTPLTFAAAVGNEAMVHMLLTHGAVAGYAEEEQHLCASFVQLIVRDHLQKRRKQRRAEEEKSKVSSAAVAMKPRSDEAMDLLVRNIAYTFLLGHYRRKIAFFRQTNRVALHEAIFNGFPSIIEILLANDARLWQKTHVLPLRVFPGAIDNVPSGRGTEALSGGWKLTPLLRRVHVLDDTREPMTTKETLALAMERYDCATYRQGHGWDPNMTHYSDTNAFVTSAFEKVDAELRHRQKEIAARKTVAKKTAEVKVLHAALETSIIARDFHAVAQLWDQGAYADYETRATGVTALMAACLGEVYLQNIDKRDVLAVEFLLDRSRNQPFVNFESSSGRTALNTCAFHGTMMCAQTLIDRGVNVNFASRKHGKTALMVAAGNGNVDFVRFLLQQPKVDVWTQDKQGKTAFGHAQEHGFDDVMHLLGAAMAGHRGHFYSSVSALYGVCKWGCGFMTNSIGNAVQHSEVIQHTHPMTHHETHTCPKRHVVCPNQCGRADLWAESLNEHVAEECVMRIVTCKQPKCGATFPFTHLSTHDRDECELRMIHCECDEFMTYQKHVVHAQTRCSMRLVPCPLECGDGVKLRFMDLKMHQRNECPNRRVRCRNGCSANELLFKQRGYHEDHLCSLRRVRCKWGCDETVLANTQQYHESDECLKRQLACPNKCGQMNVAFLDMEHHVMETCARRLVVCSMGCGRKMPLHTMENHVLCECRKRNVACELCNLVLVEDDKLAHQRSSCPQRISLCGLCGQTNIPYAELTAHRSDSCKMRQVKCKYNCFVKLLLAHEKERHETSECTLRPVWCPLGCRDVLIANTVKKHERVCVMRFVVCSLGCGTELREKDRVEHETLHCPSVSTFKRRGRPEKKSCKWANFIKQAADAMLACRHCHRALHTQPQIPTGQVLGESYVLLPTSNSPRAIQQQQQLFASQASSMLLSEEYAMGSFIGDALGGASFDTPGEGYDYYSSSSRRGHVMVPDRRVEEQYFGHEPPRQTKANQRRQNSRSNSPSQGGGNPQRQPLGYGDNHTVESLGESMSAVATHADLSHHVQLITTQNAHCAGMTVTTPACKECVDSMIEQIDRQAERARYDKRCFAGFLQSTGTSVRNEEINQIEQRIQFYEEELAALEENLQLMQKEREEIREQQQALESEGAVLAQEEVMMWNELNDLQLQEETFHDLRDLAKARIDGIEGTISSVQQLNVLHDMFSISQSGPFATINNFRVGQLPSVPVEWNEINAGFGECALLLNTLAGIVGLEFSDFKIVPLGSFSKIVRFTNLRMEYSLHGSDQDNFAESHFNLGLGAWITCLRQLIVFVEASDPTMRLPYKISKHSIKSYSILYLKNKQVEWTKALKYALTNLKWLLIWVGARGVPKRT